MSVRFLKQFIYGLVFFVIIFGLIYFFYLLVKQPSCFDGKKNQGEEGIDCGGPCPKICLPSNLRNIEVDWVKFIILDNKVILLAQIKNPNSDLAVNNFNYQFNIFDKNKNIIKTINNESFIYSEEIKYLLEFLNYQDVPNIDSLELKILNLSWVRSKDFSRPLLNVLDKNITEKDNKLYVFGRIINNDFISFKNINIIINFYKKGYWIGSSKTVINNINPKEFKEFNVIFPKIDILNINNLNDINFEIVIEAKKT